MTKGDAGDEARSLEHVAIKELRQQIRTRGDGTVWVDDWKQRFGDLTPTPRQFMETRPDIFVLHYEGNSNRFTVSLATTGSGKGKRSSAASAAAYWSEWDSYGNNRDWDWSQGKGGGFSSSSGSSWLEEAAIKEIKSLVANSHDGKIWIDGWEWRFYELGPTPKVFMEKHPEIFQLQYTGERSYTVSLVSGKGRSKGGASGSSWKGGPVGSSWAEYSDYGPGGGAWSDGAAWKGGGISWKGGGDTWRGWDDVWDSWDYGGWDSSGSGKGAGGSKGSYGYGFASGPIGAAVGKGGAASSASGNPAHWSLKHKAIEEIKDLLRSGDGSGRIWIPDWRGRYGDLASTPKVFMQKLNHIFRVSLEAGHDNRYSVALVEDEFEEDVDEAIKDDGALDSSPYACGGYPLGRDDETIAINEIRMHLSNPSNKGRVWVSDWVRRFGRLGKTPRELIDRHPDQFEVIPGPGFRYIVNLKLTERLQ
jgi:hypothetical protein